MTVLEIWQREVAAQERSYFAFVFYRPRTLNYFRGPGAPRGRLIPRTLKFFDFAFIFLSKFKAFRAQRGAKIFDFAFNFIRKFKAFRAQRGAKIFLLCSRGQGVPRGRLIFGGRLIGLGVRGHLADA